MALELRRNRTRKSHGNPCAVVASAEIVASSLPTPRRLAVLVTGRNPVASLALLLGSAEAATEEFMQVWDDIITPNDFPSADDLQDFDGSGLTRERVVTILRQTLGRELERRRSIFGPEAIAVGHRRTPMQAVLDRDGTPYNLLCPVADEAEALALRIGLRLIRYLTTRAPCGIARTKDQAGWAASQRDTALFLVQLCLPSRRRACRTMSRSISRPTSMPTVVWIHSEIRIRSRLAANTFSLNARLLQSNTLNAWRLPHISGVSPVSPAK